MPIAFDEIQFPTGISYGSTAGRDDVPRLQGSAPALRSATSFGRIRCANTTPAMASKAMTTSMRF
jgi:hypothetical protein